MNSSKANTKQKNTGTRDRLKQLYALKDRIRVEMLGQEDIEYRQELTRLIEKVDEEIAICLDRIENNLP